MGKLFDTLLLLLLVGSVVAGEGWPGTYPGSMLLNLLLRGALGVVVCLVVFKLKHWAHEAHLPMVPALRLL
jgi:hypothetical protein